MIWEVRQSGVKLVYVARFKSESKTRVVSSRGLRPLSQLAAKQTTEIVDLTGMSYPCFARLGRTNQTMQLTIS